MLQTHTIDPKTCSRSPPGVSRQPPTPSPATNRPRASGSSRWSAPRRRSRRSGRRSSSSPRTLPTSSRARTEWRFTAATSGASSRTRPSAPGRPKSPACRRPAAGTRWCTPRPRSSDTRRTPSFCWRSRRRMPRLSTTDSSTSAAPLPLHGTWAGWLWERGLEEGEIVPLQSVGVSAYRCSPKAKKLREDLSDAVASGRLTLPREASDG